MWTGEEDSEIVPEMARFFGREAREGEMVIGEKKKDDVIYSAYF